MPKTWKEDLGNFWGKVLSALSRLVALAFFMGLHWVIKKAISWQFPSNMTGVVGFAEVVIAILFLLVDLYLAWDMVVVFIPRLGRPGFGMRRSEKSKKSGKPS